MTGLPFGPIAVLLLCAGLACPGAARADCSTPSDAINTDRPDTPNNSATVPEGSLQFENGVRLTREDGRTTLDLPETRMRAGVSSCFELFVDLPNYTRSVGHGVSGATDVAPGFKYQLDGMPEPFQLWIEAGAGLPTGDKELSGRGLQPYLLLPASVELDGGFSLSAQYGAFFHPQDSDSRTQHQTSLQLEKDITDDASLFVEWTGTYQQAAAQNTADFGGTYRITPLHQIDFVLGAGLNRASPTWYFDIGYSLRFDQLF